MDGQEGSSNTFLQPQDGEVEILTSHREYSLIDINPHSLNLPGSNWVGSKIGDTSLMIYEVTMSEGWKLPRIRKYVAVNLSDGTCTSWVLDRKISEANVLTSAEIEHCVEELDMLTVCSGGPSVARFPIMNHPNAQIDIYKNWRKNSCSIITTDDALRCGACVNLQSELQSAKTRNTSQSDKPKRVIISNLSHRKQKQIIFLRSRRQSWYRKKRIAEKEIHHIDDMIAEVAVNPEDGDFDGFDDDDDDDE